MREETLLILGGYGGAGKVLADLLLQETELRLLIVGRDPAKAEALAFELNTRHSCHRVEARTLDANRPETLLPVFKESRLVIIATRLVNPCFRCCGLPWNPGPTGWTCSSPLTFHKNSKPTKEKSLKTNKWC